MKKQITINFETGNANFKEKEEIQEVLIKALQKYFEIGTEIIRDINGNTVGSIKGSDKK